MQVLVARSEINLEREEIPKSIREALKCTDREKQQQYHTGTPPISNETSVIGGDGQLYFMVMGKILRGEEVYPGIL
ncbi:MAG: hypothetical protein DWB56_08590 [Candidatus Jettenia sp.]|uniref:Uncharacterized protein n=1 Tax=Candidatus Jettenia caeni TaxID=247490 RepID=I3IK24_9BACT|nr:hypothetical protein [Candidatus Jettenia sp. AMX1]MBC6929001.1 hypothetical protein [Candidatus Jettenia sp.]NUN24572.1 hypothetical protein [Candidatus Jettenia caeni]KAA0249230.1 MAG: hypothetical protein EDM77_09520 [Candidatus Jettenia sp. AMX1]MCE7881106.1 hypothetical protein [Candidatus Jettenia sp. AMX1]MCQ3927180.1 hypothetical protein [Candidatus Jettenia sp.]